MTSRLTAIQNLRTLLTLVLTNSEARKLLSDATIIGRDLFARGAIKAGEKARPSPEQLAAADDAAPPERREIGPQQGATSTGLTPKPAPSVGDCEINHDPTTGATIIKNPDGTTRDAGADAQDAKDRAADAAKAHAQQTKDTMAEEP